MNEQEYWRERYEYNAVNMNLIYEAQRNHWAFKNDLILVKALKPRIFRDGDQWCCLYGDNIQEGIVGFGNTPNEAVLEFNKAFYNPTPKGNGG